MNNSWFYLLALLAGMGVAAQGGVNAQLRSVVGNPVLATLISFLVGTVVITLYLLLFERNALTTAVPLKQIALYKWTGGMIGALYVFLTIILAPKIGAANMMGLVVGGQMMLAVVLDHYGLLGFAQHSISLYRVLGTVLLITGVLLIIKN